MRYNKFTFKSIFLFLYIIQVVGCKKFVQIEPPDNTLITASVFNNAGTATAAVTSIYTQMCSNTYVISLSLGLLSDELKNYSSDYGPVSYYRNSMNAISTPTIIWSSAYSYIYQANAVLEKLQNNEDIFTDIRMQLTGEAKFIRAYWYFYLANCYGDVPLVIGTDYTVNNRLPRSARSIIYQQIISDLIDAKGLLNAHFIDQSDTTNSVDRVRPTKWAAAALLARVYLYTEDYAKAEMEATEVINNSSLFLLEKDLDKVFLANSSESIWQLAVPTPTTINTWDGLGFVLIQPPNNAGIFNVTTVSSQLLNAFEPGDKRRNSWVDTFVTTDPPIINYYFPYKYKVYQSNAVTEYTMILRLAEQYLIRAEARTQLGKYAADILTDLNTIRKRAGLPEYAAATDKQSLLEAILHERQVELFSEWGHRWLDLIRTENASKVMNIVTPLKGGIWTPFRQLFPIPQSERLLNTRLSQNPGY
jgi:hypothetical protein